VHKDADGFPSHLMAHDRYFLYNNEEKIDICNLTGQMTHGIVKAIVPRGGGQMADNRESSQQLKLTSLSHGAG
jgi:hypothetical protein